MSLLVGVLAAGCSFDGSGLVFSDGSVLRPDADGTDANSADAAIPDFDATIDAVNSPYPYAPSNFDPNALVPGIATVLDCGTTEFNSATLTFTNWCAGQVEPTPVPSPDVVILPLGDFEIVAGATLELVGDRPVILAVFGDATITGTLDASGVGTGPGPGGSAVLLCAVATGGSGLPGSDNGGGGGGGAFGTDGNDGGDGAVDGPKGAKGVQTGSPNLIPLRGGCSGGPGGLSDSASGGLGGGGGGAVQISAAATLHIDGRVIAAGGGGNGAACRAGAGGGGSGGGILLESNIMQIDSIAALLANGGGGGEGGANTSCSANDNGEDGHPDQPNPGEGGSGQSGSGGDGGNGGELGMTPEAGQPGQSGNGGGGGGGGAVGRIRLNALTSCAILGSPQLSPPPTSNGASGCP